MGYIDNNLVTDERVLFRTRKSLIIFAFPVVWTIFAWYAAAYMNANLMLKQINWIPAGLTVVFWGYIWLEYYFSEFAVTNKRIMMREGFFVRRANEIRLAAISQVSIDQGLIGQMLNYGIVSISAFGAADSYTMIDKPGGFQRAVNQEIDKVAGGR